MLRIGRRYTLICIYRVKQDFLLWKLLSERQWRVGRSFMVQLWIALQTQKYPPGTKKGLTREIFNP